VTKPKVCVISSRVFAVGVGGAAGLTGYGGLEQVAWYQAKGLAERGYPVALVAPDGSTCPGAEIIPTGPPGQVYDEQQAYGRPGGGYWPELKRFDVILDSSWNKWAYMARAEGWGPPVLGWLHAPCNTMYQSLPPVEKPCFVAISKDQAAHFEALYGRPARWCWNGIDLDFYRPTGVKRTNRFLFLARFSSVKSPDLAIKACRDAAVELDLIGDTSITNEPQYLEQCKAMCDGKQIALRGPCSRGEAVTWYSGAFAFIHPTKNFREPFGLAPVEAQATGLPVIGWRYGSLPEIVKDGETGTLVSSIPEMVNALRGYASAGITQQQRERCREWASQFSVSNSLDRVEKLIEEALAGGW